MRLRYLVTATRWGLEKDTSCQHSGTDIQRGEVGALQAGWAVEKARFSVNVLDTLPKGSRYLLKISFCDQAMLRERCHAGDDRAAERAKVEGLSTSKGGSVDRPSCRKVCGYALEEYAPCEEYSFFELLSWFDAVDLAGVLTRFFLLCMCLRSLQ